MKVDAVGSAMAVNPMLGGVVLFHSVKGQKAMEQHESIMFWAFRYALGRHTYAVSDVADYLIRHRAEIGATTKAMICREINEHFDKYGDGGWECDKRSWDDVVRAFSDPA